MLPIELSPLKTSQPERFFDCWILILFISICSTFLYFQIFLLVLVLWAVQFGMRMIGGNPGQDQMSTSDIANEVTDLCHSQSQTPHWHSSSWNITQIVYILFSSFEKAYCTMFTSAFSLQLNNHTLVNRMTSISHLLGRI